MDWSLWFVVCGWMLRVVFVGAKCWYDGCCDEVRIILVT